MLWVSTHPAPPFILGCDVQNSELDLKIWEKLNADLKFFVFTQFYLLVLETNERH